MRTIFVLFFAALMLGASFKGSALPFLGSGGIAGFLAAATPGLTVAELLYPVVIIGGLWSILNNAAWPFGVLLFGVVGFIAKFLPGRFLYLSFWPDRLVKGVAATVAWTLAFAIGLKNLGVQPLAFFVYFAVFTVTFKSGLNVYERIFHKT